MIKFLKILIDNTNPHTKKKWGYDQALLNHMYRSGKLKELEPIEDYCTQRTCF